MKFRMKIKDAIAARLTLDLINKALNAPYEDKPHYPQIAYSTFFVFRK